MWFMQLMYLVYCLQHLPGEADVSRLLSATPASRGCLSSLDIDSLQNTQGKAKHWKVICNDINIVDLFGKSDKLLFKSALYLNNCLHR